MDLFNKRYKRQAIILSDGRPSIYFRRKMKMKELYAVYSPVCEANGAFLGQLQEWFDGTGVRINPVPFNKIDPEIKKWYVAEGLARDNGRFVSTVFIDVFYEGKLIDSVPLSKEKIEKAMRIRLAGPCNEYLNSGPGISAEIFKALACENKIEWKTVNSSNYPEEMQMCLTNYPHGDPPERFRTHCINIKKQVFEEVFRKEDIAGLYGTYQNKVIGFIEVFPREILRFHGFLTGSAGPDEAHLTVGCLEIGKGIPRKEMIDELFFQLEPRLYLFKRNLIEGIGVYEWNEGFTPYWVYDKYGYKKSEHITENKVVMSKTIRK